MVAPWTLSCSRMLATTPVKKRSRPGICSAKRIDEGEPVNVHRLRRHRFERRPARSRVDCGLLNAFWREFHANQATEEEGAPLCFVALWRPVIAFVFHYSQHIADALVVMRERDCVRRAIDRTDVHELLRIAKYPPIACTSVRT